MPETAAFRGWKAQDAIEWFHGIDRLVIGRRGSHAIHRAFILNTIVRGHRLPQTKTMKTPLLIVATIVVLVGSGLAVMNSACKSSHHAWCGALPSIRHHAKPAHS